MPTILWIVIVCIIILLFFMRNRFYRQAFHIDHAYGEMRAVFSKRRKHMKDLLDFVSNFPIQEKDQVNIMYMMLERAVRSSDPEFIVGTECGMTILMNGLVIEMDSYPMISENEQFRIKKNAYNRIEEEAIVKIKKYNNEAEIFNHMVNSFPTNFVAELYKIGLQPIYALEEEEEENIKIAF